MSDFDVRTLIFDRKLFIGDRPVDDYVVDSSGRVQLVLASSWEVAE